MAILYGIMFLFMQGFLVIVNGKGLRWKRGSRVKLDLPEGDGDEEMANLLLL
jgi:hypothetical protein